MHKFEERNAVQLDTLFNTPAELKVHNLRQYCYYIVLQLILFFFPLIITVVSAASKRFHYWGLPAVWSCSWTYSVLHSTIHHVHHLFQVAASVCTATCHHFNPYCHSWWHRGSLGHHNSGQSERTGSLCYSPLHPPQYPFCPQAPSGGCKRLSPLLFLPHYLPVNK